MELAEEVRVPPRSLTSRIQPGIENVLQGAFFAEAGGRRIMLLGERHTNPPIVDPADLRHVGNLGISEWVIAQAREAQRRGLCLDVLNERGPNDPDPVNRRRDTSEMLRLQSLLLDDLDNRRLPFRYWPVDLRQALLGFAEDEHLYYVAVYFTEPDARVREDWDAWFRYTLGYKRTPEIDARAKRMLTRLWIRVLESLPPGRGLTVSDAKTKSVIFSTADFPRFARSMRQWIRSYRDQVRVILSRVDDFMVEEIISVLATISNAPPTVEGQGYHNALMTYPMDLYVLLLLHANLDPARDRPEVPLCGNSGQLENVIVVSGAAHTATYTRALSILGTFGPLRFYGAAWDEGVRAVFKLPPGFDFLGPINAN